MIDAELCLGDSVTVNRGRHTDATGTICRTCKYTGMVWLFLDKYKKHDYETIHFGPFFPIELLFNAALLEEKQ